MPLRRVLQDNPVPHPQNPEDYLLPDRKEQGDLDTEEFPERFVRADDVIEVVEVKNQPVDCHADGA